MITHHERLLEFNPPRHTHVMLAGRIVERGDARLAHELHDSGYAGVRARHPDAAAEERAEAEARKSGETLAAAKA
jgi:Fe-S cluster assembly ATP-binding protein